MAANDIENDGESRDKLIRVTLDNFVHEHPIGKFIMNSISTIAILTSILFICLTYWDHSKYNECCIDYEKWKANPDEFSQAESKWYDST